jgi:hypothetical protein
VLWIEQRLLQDVLFGDGLAGHRKTAGFPAANPLKWITSLVDSVR